MPSHRFNNPAATNEMQYRIVSSAAGAIINSLVNRDVHFVEIKSKRAGQSSFLIFDPESFFLPPRLDSSLELNGIKLTWNEEKSSDFFGRDRTRNFTKTFIS